MAFRDRYAPPEIAANRPERAKILKTHGVPQALQNDLGNASGNSPTFATRT